MFNKKRVFVFAVFILLMFFMMTFAGSADRTNIATRAIEFVDGFDNSVISHQIVEVGKEATEPNVPNHNECKFVGWYINGDETKKIEDFSNILDDMTIKSICEDIYFTVTFYDTIDRENLKVEQVAYGKNATAPTTRAHTGYTFDGWSRGYTNVTSNFRVDAEYSLNPVTTPVVAPNYFDVTFVDGDTKEIIKEETVREGLTVTIPEIPEHKNRVFDHFDGDYTNVDSDRTITVVYRDAEKFTVSFNAGNNGLLNTDKTSVGFSVFVNNTFKEGNVVTPSITPEKGYHFTGWDVEFSDNTVVTDNIIITAQYEANEDVSYTVKYEFTDGTPAALNKVVTNKTFNKTYTEDAVVILGYTPDKTSKDIKLDDYNKELVFVYTANKDVSYTVKYQDDKGEKLADSKLVEGKTFNETYTENAVLVTGYTPDASSKKITLDAYNKELVFVYTINEHTLTINYFYEDGKTEASPSYSKVLKYNEAYSVASPEKLGYTPSIAVVAGNMPDSNKTVKVIYTANEDVSYKVRYEFTDGTPAATTKTVIGKTFNETYTEEATVVTGYTPDAISKTITLDAYNKELVFVYTAKTDVSYSVNYVFEDGSEAATTKIVTGKTFNGTYTEEPVVVTGYVPDATSKTITLDAYDKSITFTYSIDKNISYTVRYQFTDETEAAPAKSVTGKTFNETYTENAITITGYTPDAASKTITLDAYNKELVFVYTINKYDLTINYFYPDGKTVIAPKYTNTIEYNKSYSVTSPVVLGYTPRTATVAGNMGAGNRTIDVIYDANTNTVYKIEHYKVDGTTTTQIGTTKTLTGTTDETVSITEFVAPVGYELNSSYTGTKLSGKVASDGSLVLKAYYTIADFNYTVKYNFFNKETNDYVQDLTNYPNITLSATYGTSVSYTSAPSIGGYKTPKVNPTSLKISEKVSNNVINVYYDLGEPNISINVDANITRNGSPVNGTAKYGDIITYTLTLSNTGDANGKINIKDILFASSLTDPVDIVINDYLEDATEANVAKLLSNNGLDVIVKFGEGNETVIKFTATVKAKPGVVIQSQVVYGPNDEDKLPLNEFKVETVVDVTEINDSGANISLILDLSASMKEDGKLANMKTSAIAFVNKILANNVNNTKVCLVYMPIDGANDSESKTAVLKKCSTVASDITNEISSLKNDDLTGWTPYKSGLRVASQAINSLINDNTYKYNSSHVVFFTDGDPITRTQNGSYVIDTDYLTQASYIRSKGTLYTIGYELGNDSIARLTAIASSGQSYKANSSTINNVFDSIYEEIQDSATKETVTGKAELLSSNVDTTRNITFKVSNLEDDLVMTFDEAVANGYLITTSTPYKINATKFDAGVNIEVQYYEIRSAAQKISIDASEAETNNYVKNIKLKEGSYSYSDEVASLSPTFNKETNNYTATVANNVSSLYVSATLDNNNANFKYGFGSRTVNLVVGENTILITVTNSLGDENTYQVVVTRETPENINTLSSLTLQSSTKNMGGWTSLEFTPVFNKDTLTYSAVIENSVKRIKVSGSLTSNNSSLDDDYGFRNVSNLSNGNNEILIKVISAAGEVKTYTINVCKKSNNNTCESGKSGVSGSQNEELSLFSSMTGSNSNFELGSDVDTSLVDSQSDINTTEPETNKSDKVDSSSNKVEETLPNNENKKLENSNEENTLIDNNQNNTFENNQEENTNNDESPIISEETLNEEVTLNNETTDIITTKEDIDNSSEPQEIVTTEPVQDTKMDEKAETIPDTSNEVEDVVEPQNPTEE